MVVVVAEVELVAGGNGAGSTNCRIQEEMVEWCNIFNYRNPTTRAGGGGGGTADASVVEELVEAGGGGAGKSKCWFTACNNGTVNTGGGGGGGGHDGAGLTKPGTGGSGIVIIRYKFQ